GSADIVFVIDSSGSVPTRSLRSAGLFASLFLQGLADQSECFRAAAII
ncbi:unnamed protein product, partial [marine sediment metagenome]